MVIKRGTVVRSMAGHDKGLFLAVLEAGPGYALIADGVTRTVQSPKKKNPIHLAKTATVLDEEQMESDTKLREALACFQRAKTV